MKKFNCLNGLRTIACFGIVLMHIKANINYKINGDIINTIISEFTNFVFIFMILSAFSMCCGYYEKIKNNKIQLEDFYRKRFAKTLPFFTFLLLLDVLIEHNISAIIEAFVSFTMMFGFLQKNIQVIGVAWFLGLVFLFYFIFPFFVFLFSNKKRAWITTLIAFLMNFTCVLYFNVGRQNMYYSFIYFCIGGLLYLYKDNIIKFFSKNRIFGLSFIVIVIVIYALLLNNKYLYIIGAILLSVSLICYAISYKSKILDNKFTSFIGSISLEIYLSHMVIFRVIEKLHLIHIFNNNYLSYIFTCMLTLCGTICFSKGFQIVLNKIKEKVVKNESLISK